MPVVQLVAHAKSSTLYGRTVIWSYGCIVVWLYGRTVVRSYGRTVDGCMVVQSYSCMVVQLYSHTVVQSYIQIFLARWVTTILKYIDLATLCKLRYDQMRKILSIMPFIWILFCFFIICTICNEDLSQLFLLKSSLILLSSKFSPCYLWCSATLFIL